MNLWWTWNHHSFFSAIGGDRFERLGRNPVQLVNSLSRDEIDELLKNETFLAQLSDAQAAFEAYIKRPGWWSANGELRVAYFSAEFGLHESLQTYSGGLGVLAGDFLKGASDLGVPAAGVGLLYYEGYFHQYLNADGWQQETYPQI